MADTTAEDNGPVIRPFNVTLAELDKGRVHNEISEKFHELLSKVEDTRKAGSITLSIKVSKDKNTDMVRIGSTVVLKAPAPDRREAMYYVDGDGNPSQQDPNQQALFEANEARMKTVQPISKEA